MQLQTDGSSYQARIIFVLERQGQTRALLPENRIVDDLYVPQPPGNEMEQSTYAGGY